MQKDTEFNTQLPIASRKKKFCVLGALSIFFVCAVIAVCSNTIDPNLHDAVEFNSNPEFLTSSQQTQLITDFEIVKTHVRTGTQYYTEGLSFKNSTHLIESTGLYGESGIQYVKLSTMKVTKRTKLGANYFGEGTDFFTSTVGDELIMLTYKERKMLIFNKNTLAYKRSVTIPTAIKEGWGLATRNVTVNGKKAQRLYITDGSANIYIMDPLTFKIVKTLKATTSSYTTINKLNELEFVQGKLWCNVYLTNDILVINPDTGFVEKILRMPKLRQLAQQKAYSMGLPFQSDYVLNGIAYDEATKKLVVTGKKWPLLWEIKVKGVTY